MKRGTLFCNSGEGVRAGNKDEGRRLDAKVAALSSSNNAAAGADSWKICEWKQFTDAVYDQMAEYLNSIEETACEINHKELIETPIWPEDMRTSPAGNIKKEAESPGPRDVRPITLAATLHCAWSSTRHRDAMTWAEHAWLHKTVHGGIPGARVQNATWLLLLRMEAMTNDEKEEGIATAAVDSEKYFDSTCWEVTFQMLDRMGLDQRIWKPMPNFIAHLKRFHKVAGTLGPTWTCTNSIIQGCSLSLLATAAPSTVLARVLEEEVSSATALWTIGDSVRQEKKRGNNCNQPSRSRETLTEPRRQDSTH